MTALEFLRHLPPQELGQICTGYLVHQFESIKTKMRSAIYYTQTLSHKIVTFISLFCNELFVLTTD